MAKILVTGAAGFIGYHVCRCLLSRGDTVVGVDNINAYYDPKLKEARLSQLRQFDSFYFFRNNIGDASGMSALMSAEQPTAVIHLAAQAGVRHSLSHPFEYVDANVRGTLCVLEACRHNRVGHLVYASSSSVYGALATAQFAEGDRVDEPLSLYAASKKSTELMAHTYSHLFGIPTTGLRFFTVYGPWGRPDMSMFLFAKAMLEGRAINVFNEGRMRRDFTYIDDIVEGVIRVADAPPTEATSDSSTGAPYRIFNIGSSSPVQLLDMIVELERAFGCVAAKRFLPMQPGDAESTCADVSRLIDAVGFRPQTPLSVGVARFAEWYRSYYGV